MVMVPMEQTALEAKKEAKELKVLKQEVPMEPKKVIMGTKWNPGKCSFQCS